MIEGRPSVTAQRVAVRRAQHQLIDRPLVFEDPIALRVIGRDAAATLRAAPRAGDHRLGRGLRAFVAVRSRLAEDRLAEAVRGGVRQYVVLGAGLDTFACRNPYPDLRVFEVDFPATQAWKRARLAEGGLPELERTTFVECDFGRQSIDEVLRASGLDSQEPAFCSWLGVTPYLQPATSLATIAALAPFAAGGGGRVFDYGDKPDTLGFMQRAALKMVAARVAQLGEPFVGFFDPIELVAAVRASGFARVDDYSAAALSARYLENRTDGLRLASLGRILCAHG